MTTPFQDLKFRELVYQVTDPTLEALVNKGGLTFYAGFDPTSDSLHVGSMLPLLTMKRLQMVGHKPIAVLGGATGLIGDPSGKTQERQLLTNEKVFENLVGIRKNMERILDFSSGKTKAELVNNFDWFKNLNYLTFLRDVGKHFTVNHMLGKESVRARLEDREHGISYTEFSYMLVQAYDFYVLHRDQGCRLQIGGSDQWGNITAGCELIRRIGAAESKTHEEVFGMTLPLVMKTDGGKFGKSETGTVWLDAAKTSPYQFYQYFIQTSDADVVKFLKYFTFLSHEEIRALETSVKSAPEKREAQKALAAHYTELVHGKEERLKAEQATQALFSGDLKTLSPDQLKQAFKEAPSSKRPASELTSGVLLVDLLVASNLCSSKGAARKDIAAGAIYLNNERISDVQALIRAEHCLSGRMLLLRKGKKTYHLIQFA